MLTSGDSSPPMFALCSQHALVLLECPCRMFFSVLSHILGMHVCASACACVFVSDFLCTNKPNEFCLIVFGANPWF